MNLTANDVKILTDMAKLAVRSVDAAIRANFEGGKLGSRAVPLNYGTDESGSGRFNYWTVIVVNPGNGQRSERIPILVTNQGPLSADEVRQAALNAYMAGDYFHNYKGLIDGMPQPTVTEITITSITRS